MELKYRNNPFNADKAWSPLASLARRQDPSSPELSGAIYEACDVMLFIFAPPDSFYDEKGRIAASREELLRDMERGHAYVAYLAPWVEEVRQHATEAQRQYLHEAGLDGVQDENTVRACSIGREDGEEASAGPENEPTPATSLRPDPVQAVSILESLAQQYDRSTVEHTALELAVQTLRFILDSGQVDAFRAYLVEMQKPVPAEKLARFGISAP